MLRRIIAVTLMLIFLFSFQVVGVNAEEASPTEATNGTTTTTEATVSAAASTTTEVNAGITPDNLLYKLDRLLEDIRLALVTDAAKKATLMIEMAQERLAESKAMMESGNQEKVQEALDEYKTLMTKAVNTVETAVHDGKAITEIAEKIVKKGSANTETLEKILEKTPEQYKEALKQTVTQAAEQTEAAKEAAKLEEEVKDNSAVKAVLAKRIQDPALLKKILDNKLNLRQITALISLSEQSGKPLAEVVSIFLEGNKGLGAAVHELNLQPENAMKDVNKTFKSIQSEVKAVLKQEKVSAKAQQTVTLESGQATDSKEDGEAVKSSDRKIEKEKEKEKLEKKLEKIKEKAEKAIEKTQQKTEKEKQDKAAK